MDVDALLTGTATMTNHEIGCYVRLLMYAWRNNGLPNDIKRLCKLVQNTSIPACVMLKFKVCEDGMLRNDRMEKERSKMSATQSVVPTPSNAEGQARFFSHLTRVTPKDYAEAKAYACGPHCGLTAPEAKHCFDHYESMGWKVQGEPIEDWRARFRTWKNNRGRFDRIVNGKPVEPPKPPKPTAFEAQIAQAKSCLSNWSKAPEADKNVALAFLRTLAPVALGGYFDEQRRNQITEILKGNYPL
jgi:uncharacterized protein YdaU (DUF1376 family)